MSNTNTHGQFDAERIDRMQALLERYPALDAADADEIAAFLRSGPILERGILLSRDGMRARAEALRAARKREFGMSSRDWVVVAVLLAIVLLSGVMLWDYGN